MKEMNIKQFQVVKATDIAVAIKLDGIEIWLSKRDIAKDGTLNPMAEYTIEMTRPRKRG